MENEKQRGRSMFVGVAACLACWFEMMILLLLLLSRTVGMVQNEVFVGVVAAESSLIQRNKNFSYQFSYN